MADNIIQSLFGPTPYDLQMQQQQALNQAADTYAQQTPFQRAAGGMFRAGGMLGGMVAEGMGGVNPRVQQAQQTEQILRQIDTTTADGLARGALLANQMGNARLAYMLAQSAQKMREEEASSRYRNALTEQAIAHADYYRKGGATAKGSMNDLSRWMTRRSNVAEKATIEAAKQALSLPEGQREEASRAYVEMALRAFDETNPRPDGTAPDTTARVASSVAPEEHTASSAVPEGSATTPTMAYPDANRSDEANREELANNLAIRVSSLLEERKRFQPGTQAFADVNREIADTQAQIARLGRSSTSASTTPTPKASLPTRASAAADLKRAEKAATEMGESDAKRYVSVSAAPAAINKIRALEAQLATGDVTTGLAADFRLMINKLTAALGGKEAAKRATDTELARAMMGSEVFGFIQSLGIGARGMDTPAEREFLLDVLSGRVGLEKGTLQQMAKMRREALENEVNRWNTDMTEGRIDKNTFGPQYRITTPASAPSSSGPPPGAVRLKGAK